MEVIGGGDVPAGAGRSQRPVCVLLPPVADRLRDAARWVGVEAAAAERLVEPAPRRPLARVDGGRVSLVVFAVLDSGPATAVHLHTGEAGLLVLCPDMAAPVVSRAVSSAVGDPADALVAVVQALAALSEAALDRLTDTALALDATTTGVTSGARRRAISDLRVQLFSLQQLWTAQARMLRLEISADGLGETELSSLHGAGTAFDWFGTSAAQLYALLGDTLSRQATAVSERLTLVAVVFFPLTVSTGFFGMNFGWLTARIGSAPAFLLLGVALPCVLVAATVVAARWLTRD